MLAQAREVQPACEPLPLACQPAMEREEAMEMML